MSFLSRMLERLGVITGERAPSPSQPSAVAVPLAPEDEPTGRNDELLIPEERTLLAPDPEDDQVYARAADEAPDAEITESAPERTLVATHTEVGTSTATLRRVTLASLLAERGLSEARRHEGALAARQGLDASFDEVFSAAGLGVPPNGWTVERTRALIVKARSEGLTPAQVRFLVEEALVRDGASPREVAADAVAKDEALDRYEVELARRISEAEAARNREADQVARKIDELLTTRQRLLDDAAEIRRGYAAWKARKEAAEKEWADVVDVIAPFLSVTP